MHRVLPSRAQGQGIRLRARRGSAAQRCTRSARLDETVKRCSHVNRGDDASEWSCAQANPPVTHACSQPAVAAGSVLGAVGLITGSTVGAGILALPQATHSTGFLPSAAMLVACWAVLYFEALTITEVNLHCHEQLAQRASPARTDHNRVISLAEMTRISVGPPAEAAVSSIYLCLAFTLLLAYVARAGDLLEGGMAAVATGGVPHGLGHVLFAAALGGTVALGGTSTTEKVNRVATSVMLMLFFAIIGQGAGQVEWSSGMAHADWSSMTPCLPIMFLSLVYHDLIPVVCQYLQWDRKKISKSLLMGSLIPLSMFLLWEAVCIGLVPYQEGVSVDPVSVLISTQGVFGGGMIAGFSLAALATSATGVALSLSNFFFNLINARQSHGGTDAALDTVECSDEGMSGSKGGEEAAAVDQPSAARTLAVLMTFVPPTVAGIANRDLFQSATHFAGAYGMTLLYGLLPPLLAWAVRQQRDDGEASAGVWGGRPALVSLAAIAVFIEGLQLAHDLPLRGGAGGGGAAVFDGAAAGGTMLVTVSQPLVDTVQAAVPAVTNVLLM